MARPVQDTIPQVQAILVRYLDGQEAFDDAAQDLVVILRDADRSRVSSLVFLELLSLAGRPATDRAKTLGVLDAAFRILKGER